MMQCCFTLPGAQKSRQGTSKKVRRESQCHSTRPSCFRLCIQEQDWQAYQANLYCKSLKCLLKVVLLHTYHPDGRLRSSKLFASTDTSISGIDLWYYYHLRFQIEFLYRDAKQLLGLKHCQSRQDNRLNFQFNFSLSLISLAKIVHYLSVPLPTEAPSPCQTLKPNMPMNICSNVFFKPSAFVPIPLKRTRLINNCSITPESPLLC